MKFLIIIICCLYSFQVLAETVNIGYFLMPPFILESESSSDKLEGVVVDYFDNYLAPKMGVTFNWQGPLSVPRLINHLTNGEVHLTPMLSKTPKRERLTLYTNESFISFNSGIVLKKSYPLDKISSPQELIGLTFIYVLGSPIPPILDHDKIKFIRVGHKNWAQSNLTVVLLDRADGAYFPNTYEPQYYIDKKKLPLKVLKLPGPMVVPYTVFSKKTPLEIINRFNTINHEAIKNHVFRNYLDDHAK